MNIIEHSKQQILYIFGPSISHNHPRARGVFWGKWRHPKNRQKTRFRRINNTTKFVTKISIPLCGWTLSSNDTDLDQHCSTRYRRHMCPWTLWISCLLPPSTSYRLYANLEELFLNINIVKKNTNGYLQSLFEPNVINLRYFGKFS